jgi:hypothetical protein
VNLPAAFPDTRSGELRTIADTAARLRPSLGRRGTALALALAVELGLAILLLFLWPVLSPKKDVPKPAVFGIDMGDDRPEAAKAAERAARRAAAPKPQPDTPKPPVTPPPPKVETPPLQPLPPEFVRMTRPDYSSSDIADIPRQAPAPGSGDAGEAARSGGGAGDSEVAGKGPHGETLYAAEWYTRPTQAQLSTYRSRRAQGPGWGLIACRTVAGYRVEDCQELAESPRGSGYAGSVRQAAWQFRVRPPRVNGKLMVGEWVSIRIDYTISGE